MSVDGKSVVVTGVIAGESRVTAERKLREAGAFVSSSVTAKTDLLVTGAKVGPAKIRKAEALGVAIIPWEQVFGPFDPEALQKLADACGPVTVIDVKPGTAEHVHVKPRQIGPMLAKKGELPIGPGWQHEVKWDGYRCIATIREGKVAMQSRSGKSEYVEQFPAIAKQLAGLPSCVVDGELVVLDANGRSDFEQMDSKGEASYVLFDILEDPIHGDVRRLPLCDRRALLERLLHTPPRRIMLGPTFDDGEVLLDWVAENGWEGIVSKKRSSTYQEGARNGDWIKVKVRLQQAFAVIGWKPGEGRRSDAAGSLLLAVYDGKRYVFVGRVGTGQEDDFWHSIPDLPKGAPVVDTQLATRAELRDAVFVEPSLVVQVRFQRWTEDGRLWHPSVAGVRNDKKPTECRRES